MLRDGSPLHMLGDGAGAIRSAHRNEAEAADILVRGIFATVD